MTEESYEGLQENIRDLKLPEIETWESKYPEKGIWIEHRIPEFTCLCPKTGLPDFATISVRYVPDKLCIELKSLKLYIVAYRDVGIFHEHVVNKVLEDFVSACKPMRAEIIGEFNARGGIGTSVVAEYTKEGTDHDGCGCGHQH